MMPDNEMGNPDNITTEKLRKAARAGGNLNLKQLVESFIRTYESQIKDKPVENEPIR
ncbi:MAG: hypothetical protein HY677_03660 [Chloroflexi bacterium]|nr:hypothetical protein [Chloroflexota bacterium]